MIQRFGILLLLIFESPHAPSFGAAPLVQWVNNFAASNLAVDNRGSFYFTGPYGSTAIKCAGDGTVLWAAPGPGGGRVAVDTEGNCIVAASQFGSGISLTKLDPDGKVIWSKEPIYVPTQEGYGQGVSNVAIDGDGNCGSSTFSVEWSLRTVEIVG